MYTWSIILVLGFSHLAYGLRGVGSSSLVRSKFQHQFLRKMTKSSNQAQSLTPQESFAKLVSQGFVDKDVNLDLTATGYVEHIDFSDNHPSEDRISKYFISSGNNKAEVWTLPTKHLTSWLHNLDSKQDDSIFKNILIRRCDDVSLKRDEEALQELLESYAPIYIGSPGIGKSISTTVMLVKALETIVKRYRTPDDETKPDGFEEVYYRVSDELLCKFSWDTDMKELKCTTITDSSERRK